MSRAEFEVKVRLSGVELSEIAGKLANLGFSRSEDVYEEDHYFDLRGCSGYTEGSVLRFRRVESASGVRYKLTYKSPATLSGVKARDEFEVELGDDGVFRVLKMLGLRDFAIRKRRSYFTGADMSVSIDEVECLGNFMEFEKVNPRSAEEFIARVRDVLRKLGLDGSELISKSYLELFLASNCK
ncbi:MAG: class IV adenylate cyclase [Sulfolobales archaeon]|nr:class IV adenylate cyclase [Sulfolobales archaeon]MCX8209100.1 class IV adenylate cyclase [Sulfolobales archaeon]MDW8010258.1 class IV adenylate cyclase [Sulfolobales archaeon]